MKKIFFTTALFILGVTLFNSCKKGELENVFDAEEQFLFALKLFEDNFFATPVNSNTDNREVLRTQGSSNFETIYLDVFSEITPTILSMFENIRTMQDVLNFRDHTGAGIEYTATETNVRFQLDVDISDIEMELNSMVSAAKQYLHAVGLKEQEIQEMLTNKDLPELAVISIAIDYQLEGLTSPSLTSCRRACSDSFTETVNIAALGFMTGIVGCSGKPICSGVVLAIYIASIAYADKHFNECVAKC
ncbi:MAG: hypothetical protein FWE63_00405 [Bacteroidales bacterium]|nr:hypothetical protein [Bacteroidales bacterium]